MCVSMYVSACTRVRICVCEWAGEEVRNKCLRCTLLPRVTATYLHPFHRVGKRAGFVDEVSVFHVLSEPLQEAQRLIEYDRHCDLRQLLLGRNGTCVISVTNSRCVCCSLYSVPEKEETEKPNSRTELKPVQLHKSLQISYIMEYLAIQENTNQTFFLASQKANITQA